MSDYDYNDFLPEPDPSRLTHDEIDAYETAKLTSQRDKLVGIVEKLISDMRCRSRDLYEASELLRDAGVAANGLCYDSSMTALDSAAWAERLLAEIRGGK